MNLLRRLLRDYRIRLTGSKCNIGTKSHEIYRARTPADPSAPTADCHIMYSGVFTKYDEPSERAAHAVSHVAETASPAFAFPTLVRFGRSCCANVPYLWVSTDLVGCLCCQEQAARLHKHTPTLSLRNRRPYRPREVNVVTCSNGEDGVAGGRVTRYRVSGCLAESLNTS